LQTRRRGARYACTSTRTRGRNLACAIFTYSYTYSYTPNSFDDKGKDEERMKTLCLVDTDPDFEEPPLPTITMALTVRRMWTGIPGSPEDHRPILQPCVQ